MMMLFFLFTSLFFLVLILIILIHISVTFIAFVLYSQIVFQTVRQYFIYKHSSQLEIVFELFSDLHLVFSGFQGVSSGSSGIMRGKEVEKTFGLDLPSNQSMLPSLFIFLFFLDLLHRKVLMNPINMSPLRKNRSLVLQNKSLLEFSVLDNLVGRENEMDSEVVTSFLISHVNVVNMLQQLFIFLSHRFFHHRSIHEAFPPITLNFMSSEVVGDLLDLIFSQVLLRLFYFFLLECSFASDDVSNLSLFLRITLVSTGSSSLRYFFSISLVAFSISSSIFLISLYLLQMAIALTFQGRGSSLILFSTSSRVIFPCFQVRSIKYQKVEHFNNDYNQKLKRKKTKKTNSTNLKQKTILQLFLQIR